MAIEPHSRGDSEKLAKALTELGEEDPTFRIKGDEETGETIISGMGELHLEILRERMLREFKVDARVGKPQVSYKETITISGEGEVKYVKQTGGRGQYAHVKLEIVPNQIGKGNEIINKIVGGAIPKEFIPATIKGIEEGLATGVVAGYQLVDTCVRIVYGSYHEVDSSEMAFKICAAMAIRDAAKKCKPVLLEPIMEVVVTTPEEYIGDVIGDINRRRGKILTQQGVKRAVEIKSEVPFKGNIWLLDRSPLPELGKG